MNVYSWAAFFAIFAIGLSGCNGGGSHLGNGVLAIQCIPDGAKIMSYHIDIEGRLSDVDKSCLGVSPCKIGYQYYYQRDAFISIRGRYIGEPEPVLSSNIYTNYLGLHITVFHEDVGLVCPQFRFSWPSTNMIPYLQATVDLSKQPGWFFEPPTFSVAGKRIAVMPFKGSNTFSRQIEACLLNGATYATKPIGNETEVTGYILSQVPTLGKTLSEKTAKEHAVVVSRSELQSVLKEQDLQISDLVDPKTAVRIGKLVGAKYIFCGEVNTVIGADLVRTDVRWAQLIDVETGRVAWSWQLASDNTGYPSLDQSESHSANSIVGQIMTHVVFRSPSSLGDTNRSII